MSARILDFPERSAADKSGGDAGPPPRSALLIYEAQTALGFLKGAKEFLADERDIDRTKRSRKQLEALVETAAKALEKGIAAHTRAARHEFGNIVREALGPGATGYEIDGARNMLEAILEALPD